MENKLKKKTANRRAAYALPNFFSILSLFFGFYSILASVGGRFSLAAWYILFATVCDSLDGTVARLTHTTSRFGFECDSLCDLVSFGVAPAVMVYLWALTPGSLASISPNYHLGAGAAFIFLACGTLRLARFNVSSGTRDPGFFQGLPISGGALISAAAVLWHYRLGSAVIPWSPAILALTLTLAVLMVSNLDYFSHKNKYLSRDQRPFGTLIVGVLLLGLLIVKMKSILLPLGFLYLASGPVVTFIRFRRRTKASRADEAGDGRGQVKDED